METSLNVKKWNIGDNELGIYCVSPYGSSGDSVLKLYIPTLMPFINGPGKPIQVINSLSSSCFINDTSCKPSLASTIKTQNYKSVEVLPNRNFNNPYFLFGTKIMLEVFNSDPQNIKVTNKIDNSITL
jgi:hypothetical protein